MWVLLFICSTINFLSLSIRAQENPGLENDKAPVIYKEEETETLQLDQKKFQKSHSYNEFKNALRIGNALGIVNEHCSFTDEDENDQEMQDILFQKLVNIHLDHLEMNIDSFQSVLGGHQICAVLKNNAYGHGINFIAETAYKKGIRNFGVCENKEVKDIQQALKDASRNSLNSNDYSIIRLRHTNLHEFKQTLKMKLPIEELVGSFRQILEFEDLGQKLFTKKQLKVSIPVHLSIDSNMGRGGFSYKDCFEDKFQSNLETILSNLEYVDVVGIMTHFPNAEDINLQSTIEAVVNFNQIIENIILPVINRSYLKKNVDTTKPKKITIHAYNSAAFLRISQLKKEKFTNFFCGIDCLKFPQLNLNFMVRLGSSLYGLKTKNTQIENLKMYPVMSFETKISEITDYNNQEGGYLGYNRVFVPRGSKVALINLGSANGVVYELAKKDGFVLIKGKRCPILEVGLQQTFIDVTDKNLETEDGPIKIFDRVILLGQYLSNKPNDFTGNSEKSIGQHNTISAEEIAKKTDSDAGVITGNIGNLNSSSFIPIKNGTPVILKKSSLEKDKEDEKEKKSSGLSSRIDSEESSDSDQK